MKIIDRKRNVYEISEELKKELEGYLSLGMYKNFHDLTSFIPENELQLFIDKTQKLYDKNKNLFNILKRNIIKKNKNLNLIILLSTVYKDSRRFNFEEELKRAPDYTKKYYSEIKSHFDECSFFVLSERYEKEMSGAKFIGRKLNNRTTEFVLSKWASSEVVKAIENNVGWDAQQSAYVNLLGYPKGYLDQGNSNALYQVIIDGDIILKKKDEFLLHKDTIMHFPNGDEAGVNEYWISGGVTYGGIFEMVIDNLPNTSKYIKKVYKFPFEYKDNMKYIAEKHEVEHVYYDFDI